MDYGRPFGLSTDRASYVVTFRIVRGLRFAMAYVGPSYSRWQSFQHAHARMLADVTAE